MKSSSIVLAAATLSSYDGLLLSSATPLPPTCKAPSGSGLKNASQHTSEGGSSLCVSGIATVHANTTKNIKFNYELPKTQAEATQTWIKGWSAGSSNKAIENGTLSAGGAYDIGATLCVPCNSTTSKLQILTHGIGFTSSYWDFAPGHTYVDAATKAGYATFAYDRLGVGVSSKEHPLNTIQSPLEQSVRLRTLLFDVSSPSLPLPHCALAPVSLSLVFPLVLSFIPKVQLELRSNLERLVTSYLRLLSVVLPPGFAGV